MAGHSSASETTFPAQAIATTTHGAHATSASTRMATASLHIAQININSIRNKLDDVRNFLEQKISENKLYILLINDTRLNDEDTTKPNLNFRGFYLLRQDHRQNTHVAGGVAALVPSQIRSIVLDDFSSLDIETLAFEITFC